MQMDWSFYSNHLSMFADRLIAVQQFSLIFLSTCSCYGLLFLDELTLYDMPFQIMKAFFWLTFLPLTFSLNPNLLKQKNVKHLIILNCNNNLSSINLQKTYFVHKIRSLTADFNSDFPKEKPYFKIGIFLNATCPKWQIVFQGTDIEFMFKNSFIWFIYSGDKDETVNSLKKYPIEVDSDVTIITENNGITELFEVYNSGVYTNGSWFIQQRGSFAKTGLIPNENMRRNMTGVSLKCMAVIVSASINDTVTHYLEKSIVKRGSDVLNKLKFFTVLKYLREMYNFSYVIKRTKSWGYPHNGSFDGMVGALQRNEIDIGCSPIFFWSERAEVIDYTVQTWRSRQSFILRHPKRLGAYYTIFTRPLSMQVWASLAGMLCVCGGLLAALVRCRPLLQPGDEADRSGALAALAVWSALCQQGMPLNRGSTTINIVLFSTFLSTLMLYQYYNASVVSSLLREPPKNIRTLEDLLKSDLKAGIENYPFTLDYFQRTTHTTAIKLYNEKIITKRARNVFDLQTGMAKVKEGGFAFHVDTSNGYHYMTSQFSEKEICEAQEIQLFPPMEMVSAVKKGSPYREMITYGLRRMFEAGLFYRIKNQWDQSRPECPHTPDASVFTISIYEASTPFIVLAIAVPVSMVVLICEVLTFRFNKRRLSSKLGVKFLVKISPKSVKK